MLREGWRRPSIVLAGWASLLVLVFVLSGDLRVERAAEAPRAPLAANAGPVPVVVRANGAPRRAPASIVRHGRVYDAMGFLLVGAEVLVAGREPMRTDADGRFAVELGAGDPTEVTIRSPGHRSHVLRVHTATPEPLSLQLALGCPFDGDPAPPVALPRIGEGRVETAAGEPVASAEVHALGTDAWARTDANGCYRLPLPAGAPTIVVHDADDRLVARSEPLELERDTGIVPVPDLVARTACAVGGTVRDVHGDPVAGVPVRVLGQGAERLVETGAGGAFRIGGLEPGQYTLRPFAFRGALGVPQNVVLDRPRIDCELLLMPLAERRLRVVRDGGEPLAAATVVAEYAGERTSVHRSDADGWTQVRIAEGAIDGAWRFDVRVGEAGTPAEVRHYDAEAATLVVAAP